MDVAVAAPPRLVLDLLADEVLSDAGSGTPPSPLQPDALPAAEQAGGSTAHSSREGGLSVAEEPLSDDEDVLLL